MARVCYLFIGKQAVDESKQNSYITKSSGVGPKIMNQALHGNNTFFYSTKTEECLERLKNNQSDISTSTSSYFENLDGYTVPVPMFANKIRFIAGYKLDFAAVKPEECATVMDNVQLLGPFVHLASLALIFSSVLVVLAGILMQLQYKENKIKGRSRHLSNYLLMKYVMKQLMKELSLIYNGKSHHFKWIGFLFTMLCFYLVLSFNSLYKTSQIIVNEPYVIKDYRMLLEDKTSLPIFFDSVASASTIFKSAGKNTPRGKIWSKLINSRTDIKQNIVPGGADFNPDYVKQLVARMNDSHDIFISTTLPVTFMHAGFCCFSPESELWKLNIFTDDSEKEDLLGYPVSNYYPNERSVTRSMRLYAESYLSEQFLINYIAFFQDQMYTLFGSSVKHQFEQNLVCSPEFKLDAELDVEAIGFGYYRSFFITLLAVLFLSCLVYLYEKFSFKGRRKKTLKKLITKQIRHRRKLIPFQLTPRQSRSDRFIYQ